jgi:HEPN domain-containing protein
MPLTPAEEDVLAQWLRSARSDLLFSEVEPPEGVMYEQPCFHAQQAVEKALKALLLGLDEDPPRIHEIEALIDLVRKKTDFPDNLVEATALTTYAVVTRYPPFARVLTREDWTAATRTARRVLEWVEQQLTPPDH